MPSEQNEKKDFVQRIHTHTHRHARTHAQKHVWHLLSNSFVFYPKALHIFCANLFPTTSICFAFDEMYFMNAYPFVCVYVRVCVRARFLFQFILIVLIFTCNLRPSVKSYTRFITLPPEFFHKLITFNYALNIFILHSTKVHPNLST